MGAAPSALRVLDFCLKMQKCSCLLKFCGWSPHRYPGSLVARPKVLEEAFGAVYAQVLYPTSRCLYHLLSTHVYTTCTRPSLATLNPA